MRKTAHLATLLVLTAVALFACTQDATPTGNNSPNTVDSRTSGSARALASGAPLRDAKTLYPRAIRLTNSGSNNGRVIASLSDVDGNPEAGVVLIYESTNNGSSFAQVGSIADPEATGGQGLCCGSIFELPQQIGSMPAGTLLYIGSVGSYVTDRRMALKLWQSNNLGRDWNYVSSCAVASNTGGLWEPELSVSSDGQLVCHFADETDGAYSQKLARSRSSDGITWTDRTNTIASSLQSDRPGMPNVRKLPDGTYFMSFEICTPSGQYLCVVHARSSSDGWNWGSVTDLGFRPETVDGKYFRHAPTIALASSPDRILLIGQILVNRDGSVATGNGDTVLQNTDNGEGFWYEVPAPVSVPNPYNNYCPNYSSSLLPSTDGVNALEIATDYDNSVCKPYFATAGINGSRTASGVVNGATYRLVNVRSGQCLDVAADSRVAGGNVQQYTCNDLGPQNWILTDRGSGYYSLRGQNSGLCLDVAADSRLAGGNIQQWDCNNG